jgi:hypothetical protein
VSSHFVTLQEYLNNIEYTEEEEELHQEVTKTEKIN